MGSTLSKAASKKKIKKTPLPTSCESSITENTKCLPISYANIETTISTKSKNMNEV